MKFPWRLTVGENVWVGEGLWIDNLDEVYLGANCCISQGAYLCTTALTERPRTIIWRDAGAEERVAIVWQSLTRMASDFGFASMR